MSQNKEKGRERGRGRGRDPHMLPYQNAPPGQARGQRNQLRWNNHNSDGTCDIPSQPISVPEGFFNAQHVGVPASIQPEPSASTSTKEKVKTRTVHPEELGIELKTESALTPYLPRRPEKPGNLGRRIQLISNCFPIEIPSGYVYHYDVQIKRLKTQSESGEKAKADNHSRYKCLNTRTNRKVISYLIDSEELFNNLYPAFDGKNNLYTRKELKADFPLQYDINLTNENYDGPQSSQDVYGVKIKPVKKQDTESCAINLDSIHAFFERKTDLLPEEAMMAVETILRHSPCLRFTPVGRSFYYSPNASHLKPIGGGVEIWLGYHQSIRLGQWQPTVNLDTTATTFLSEGSVLNYIANSIDKSVEGLHRMPFMEEKDITKITHQLANKEVRVIHLKYRRRYRIIELAPVSANKMLITVDDNELTVAEFFKQKHGIELKYPNLPLFQVKPKDKNIFLPLEVCEFTPGQHYKSELTQSQKTNMIRFTSIPPGPRFKKIDDIVKTARFDSDKCAREFNLKVSKNPLDVEARILQSPNLIYAGEKKISPKNGSWNMQSAQFLKGGEIPRWVLISFRHHAHLAKFTDLLVKTCQTLGIKIGHPFRTKIVDSDGDIQSLLSEAKRQANLVVVVIPQAKEKEEKRIYTTIKKAAETLIGLTTQCIKEERLKDMDKPRGSQIVRNLCLKINAKMGGENYSLLECETPKILWKPVIIIGADVSHPPPTETVGSKKFKQPSIAACVGSLDSFCKRFAATVRPQPKMKEDTFKTEEIICNLEDMTVDILKSFYRHTNGKKPEKIIFYRDGVSEGDFAAVKTREVVSIRNACRKLQKDYEPGITFIVVQKRHHVRFKTKDPRDAIKENVPAGSVVDTVVTHPLNFDFFLCSQAGIQGTSRPRHYTVIEDDNDFSVNDLQKMTFQFCHMYVRCTKSISVPAPVAYAHLVAYRARKYLYNNTIVDDCNNSNASSVIHRSILEDLYKAIKVVDDLKGSMYFV